MVEITLYSIRSCTFLYLGNYGMKRKYLKYSIPEFRSLMEVHRAAISSPDDVSHRGRLFSELALHC